MLGIAFSSSCGNAGFPQLGARTIQPSHSALCSHGTLVDEQPAGCFNQGRYSPTGQFGMKKYSKMGSVLLVAAVVTVSVTVGVVLSQSGNDKYDADGDGLIEVSNLEQLNAIRYDLDGDGRSSV